MKSISSLISTSRIARYGFGLAFSGGVVVLMSGTAFAAEPTVIANAAVTANQTATTSVTAVATSVTTTSNSSSSVMLSDAAGTSTTKQPASVTTAEDMPSTQPLQPVLVVPTAQVDSPAAPADTAPAVQSIPTPIQAAAAAIATSVSAAYRTPDEWTAPVISTVASDIDAIPAASSAPTPKRLPFKSSGLLGQLTSSLAAIIAPASVRLFGPGLRTPFAIAIICFFFLLMTSVLSDTFGTLLRRSGYSNAARSDLPSFTFAPSQLLGYVPVGDRVT